MFIESFQSRYRPRAGRSGPYRSGTFAGDASDILTVLLFQIFADTNTLLYRAGQGLVVYHRFCTHIVIAKRKRYSKKGTTNNVFLYNVSTNFRASWALFYL